MQEIDAVAFADRWVAAWNRRDVEAVLRHFHDDAVFTSPVAQRIGFAEDGVVRGKDALRAYWNSALERNPNLHFTLTGVFKGVDVLVFAFTTQDGSPRTEVLKFSGVLVVEGYGTVAA